MIAVVNNIAINYVWTLMANQLNVEISQTRAIPVAVNFDAREFIQRKSLMPAVIFDKTASVHGMDLCALKNNGSGCCGSTVARILAGSGYTLHGQDSMHSWTSSLMGLVHMGDMPSPSLRDRSMPLPSSHTCDAHIFHRHHLRHLTPVQLKGLMPGESNSL